MTPNRRGPLTEADYQKLNKVLADLENTHLEIQTAKQAGFDCAAEDQQCQALKERFVLVKKAYFPQRP